MQPNDTRPVQSTQEEWRPILGYEGIYEVSSFGQVRSLDREDCAGRQRKGQMLRPSQQDGYPFVLLCKDRARRAFRVHRLVADAFLGVRPQGYEIHHKDHGRGNPSVDNLEYVTHAENIQLAVNSGNKGKLSPADVKSVCLAYANNTFTVSELAEKYSVSEGIIRSALSGRSYSVIFAGDDALIPVKFKGSTKVSDDVVREIREKYESGGHSCYTLAREYDLHPTTINKIVLKIRRTTVI